MFGAFAKRLRQADGSKAMKLAYLLGLAVTCIAIPALAKPAYVASSLNLRAAPGTGSEIVAKIPGGSLVDAGACDEGWCEVSWQDKKGFAIQSAIDMSGRVPQQRAAAAAPPAYRPPPQGVQGGPQGPRGPQVVRGPQVMEGPEIVDGPVYYDAPPPPVVYYGGPYYRPYWGWRRHWW
jgi:Bacterial SH3 domain